jgi:hypothetical protein
MTNALQWLVSVFGGLALPWDWLSQEGERFHRQVGNYTASQSTKTGLNASTNAGLDASTDSMLDTSTVSPVFRVLDLLSSSLFIRRRKSRQQQGTAPSLTPDDVELGSVERPVLSDRDSLYTVGERPFNTGR